MNLRILFTTFIGCSLATSISLAERVRPHAEIKSPASGQVVKTEDHVTIKMHQPGIPIVAIRSADKGSKWWIQKAGEFQSDSQTYVVPVRFGNDRTPVGTRFLVTALVAPDAKSAASIVPLSALESLPTAMSQTEVHEVVIHRGEIPLQRPALTAELISPQPGSEATWIQNVVVKIKEPSSQLPRLLVQFAGDDGAWWVQEPLERSGDRDLIGIAHIGNKKTPAGSKFLLMLVCPEQGSSREALTTGLVLDDLSEFRCSKTFTVTKKASEDDVPKPVTATVAEPASSVDVTKVVPATVFLD